MFLLIEKHSLLDKYKCEKKSDNMLNHKSELPGKNLRLTQESCVKTDETAIALLQVAPQFTQVFEKSNMPGN